MQFFVMAFFVYFPLKYNRMYRLLFLLLLSIYFSPVHAQHKETKVIVLGDNEAAWSAAVQSAKSGVQTLWLRSSKQVGNTFIPEESVEIEYLEGLNTGNWNDFLVKSKGIKIESGLQSKYRINGQLAQNAFAAVSDSLKNLEQWVGVSIKSIKTKGKQLTVTLSNNRNLKVYALVSTNPETNWAIGKDKNPLPSLLLHGIGSDSLYKDKLFKTSLVSLFSEGTINTLTTHALLEQVEDNVFLLPQKPTGFPEEIKQIPNKINLGQVLGASAAYCAFFKVSTEKINIRTLQGEILNFKGQLLPFTDISLSDPNYAAIQRIGATGLLKGEDTPGNFLLFHPENRLSSEEIKPTMLALFTRSQLWFKDKSIEELKTGDLVNLLMFTALKGEELFTDIEKRWNSTFKLEGTFDRDSVLTRRQFSVLVDFYLKPFTVKVNNQGDFSY